MGALAGFEASSASGGSMDRGSIGSGFVFESFAGSGTKPGIEAGNVLARNEFPLT